MARKKKSDGANRGKKSSPRQAGPQKATKTKTDKKSRGAKKPHPHKGEKFPGRKAAQFEEAKKHRKALGLSGPGPNGEFYLRGPDGTFCTIHGRAEKGCEGFKCACGNGRERFCHRHPSRVKVQTGRFFKPSPSRGERGRPEWVPKDLVEAGVVEVEEPVEECA